MADLARWATTLGFAPSVPEGCRSAALGDSLLVDCGGAGLVFAPETSPSALIEAQVSPFADAGIPVPSPTARACTVQGAAADCLGTTITIPPGAPMTILAGRRADQGWSVLCLHRQASLPALCADYFATSG